MPKRFDTSAARRFFVLSLLALPLFSGCGYLTRWYNGRPGPPNPHSVTLTWTASPSPIQGYYVYRTASTGAPVRLNVRVVEGTQYTDHTVAAGQTYDYYVTSVDVKGVESAPSAHMTVSVPWTAKPPTQQ
ncbi:MAG TPA: fibronectin type III domain-containing protein [Candidatus Acidoferrales bacterium]|nr:fibronectin type III domain-containing protein [Candidatus Acidoferrales bacterium]